MALRTEQDDTPLQKKLNVLADWIAKIGAAAALLLFLVLFIKFCAQLPRNHESPSEKGQAFLKIFIVSVTVVVVAVPEGLPLAVTLALSFATVKMLRDNNLVRVLKACETMGNATTVCSDKTGTLTQNKMALVAAVLGTSIGFGGLKQPFDNDPKVEQDDFKIPSVSLAKFKETLSPKICDVIIQSNALNSTAFEADKDSPERYIGPKTEVALLTFCCEHLGMGPLQEIRSAAETVQVVPFDSKYKYSAVVVRLANGMYRAYVKDASEILVMRCTNILTDVSGAELSYKPMTPNDRAAISSLIDSYAGQSLRTIGSSYRDFESWPPEGAAQESDDKMADFTKTHSEMILIGVYGIKDPLRPTVIEAIKDCCRAGVYVRMVTEDNINTASAIALECGIYKPEEGGITMEGPEFRRLSPNDLQEKARYLQVLARSSPEDKKILVRTLKELGETVAVTGDGTNDAPALKMADIGFSMGIAGTEVAKEASSIVLLDDKYVLFDSHLQVQTNVKQLCLYCEGNNVGRSSQ